MDVVLSCPVIRTDNGVANAKLLSLRNRLKRSGNKIINNENISVDHLGKKGLHLTGRGTGRLAMNMIAYMQRL